MGSCFSSSRPRHSPGATAAKDKKREDKAREEKNASEKKLQEARAADDAKRSNENMAQQAKMLKDAEDRAEEATRKLKKLEEMNRKKEEDRKNYPVPEFLEKAIKSGKLNIAVAGNSGVGKSSFINFMRGMNKPSQEGYAVIGIVETTSEPEAFPLCVKTEGGALQAALVGVPIVDSIWDLPGVGTESFPEGEYLQKMGIRYFDVVLLCTADRFTSGELMLKREMDEKCVPYFCVRTKADIAWNSKIDAEQDALGDDDAELTDERKQELKNATIKELQKDFKDKQGIDVYLIASRLKFKGHWDYEKLHHDLQTSITNARCDHACPVCMEEYVNYGGLAGKIMTHKCGHILCETCFEVMYVEKAQSKCHICREIVCVHRA